MCWPVGRWQHATLARNCTISVCIFYYSPADCYTMSHSVHVRSFVDELPAQHSAACTHTVLFCEDLLIIFSRIGCNPTEKVWSNILPEINNCTSINMCMVVEGVKQFNIATCRVGSTVRIQTVCIMKDLLIYRCVHRQIDAYTMYRHYIISRCIFQYIDM